MAAFGFLTRISSALFFSPCSNQAQLNFPAGVKMASLNSRSPKSVLWFSLAAVFALLGGLLLWLFLSQPPAGQVASPAEVYTGAELTLAAQAAASTPTPTLTPTDAPTGTPTGTDFPNFSFTQPSGSPSAAPVSGGLPCNDAIYVSDVTIPDGTVMAPGTSFVKTWAFQNTGSCTWFSNYELTFVSGDQMSGATASLGQVVAPSSQIQTSVTLTAPAAQGTYIGYWRLADNQGNAFGGVVSGKIVGSNAAPTGTPTATSTSGSTGAPTAVQATTAASTPTPTQTPSAPQPPTATSTPTFTPSPTATAT